MGRSIDALLKVNPARLSQRARLAHLERLRVAAARLAAQTERTIAAASDVDDEKSIDREEIACLQRWSFGYTQARIVQAHKLVDHLPATLEALSKGVINAEHARAAAEASYSLDARLSSKVEKRVLDRAGSQTVTEFKRSLTRAVHRVDPSTAENRHEEAKAQRGIWRRNLPDGMAGLYTVHDAVTIDAMYTRIAGLAEKAAQAGPDDVRSADARRADTLADLVLDYTSAADLPRQHGRRPTVHLLVPLDIALGLSDLPGELLGYGPIPASLCRETLADPTATIRRAVIGPLGELVDCSTVYQPSQALADRVILRDRTCRMPGCNRQTCTCELDHIVPFDGTNTTETNLHGLCCRHHHAKHDYGWTVTVDADRVTRWTSPNGRRYAKPPDPWPESPLLNPELQPPPEAPPRSEAPPGDVLCTDPDPPPF